MDGGCVGTFLPLRTCEFPGGCPNTSPHRRCAKHRRKSNRARKNAVLYDVNWRNASRQYLQSHPTCVCVSCKRHRGSVCGKRATEVDHRVPHEGNLGIFWNTKEWQAMCKACHSSKTMKENHSSGRLG